MVDDNGESIKIQKVPSGLSQSMLLFWGLIPQSQLKSSLTISNWRAWPVLTWWINVTIDVV